MPFNTTPSDWAHDSSIKPIQFRLEQDEPLLEFIADQWQGALQPCVDEIIIIRLDKDDDLFDGTYIADALLKWWLPASNTIA